MLLAGRAAEQLIFKQVTTGAHNDLEIATAHAQRMVCEYGMSKKLGNLTFGKKDQQVFLGRDLMRDRDYSERTAVTIDEEVSIIIDESYKRALEILEKNLDKLKKLSDQLLEKEVLEADEVRKIIGLDNIPKQNESGPSEAPDKSKKPD